MKNTIEKFNNPGVEDTESSASKGGLNNYIQSIKGWKDLSKTEEEMLWKNKTKENLDKIIHSHLRMVITVVNKIYPYDHRKESDFMDLVQAGNLGLLKAVETYNPEKNSKFSTHAYFWIKTYIKNELSEKRCGAIKKPISVIASFGIISKVENKLKAILYREPTLEEIHTILDDIFTYEKLNELLMLRTSQVLSLDFSYDDDDKDTLLNCLPAESLEEELDQQSRVSSIREEVKKLLNPRLYVLICARYGLEEFKDSPKTLDEIAQIFVDKGFNDKILSTERIRQLEEQAIKILQKDPTLLSLFNNN